MTHPISYLYLASIALLMLFFASCRSAKHLNEDQALVTRLQIEGSPQDLKESASLYISNELRPNSRFNLTIYNIFNTKNRRYKTENIKNLGEPPHVLDSALVELSSVQLKRFFNANGYFDATVTPQISIKNKKAKIEFKVDTAYRYTIRKVEQKFEDAAVKDVYDKYVLNRTLLKSSRPFQSEKIYKERENLYDAMRQEGYYQYLRQYMQAGIDTIGLKNRADIILNVTNPKNGKHRVFYIDSVFVKINDPVGKPSKKAVNYTDTALNIVFQDETGKFRLRPLSRYTFLKQGSRYDMHKETLSYDRLYETNGFRSVKIDYDVVDSTTLNISYQMIPRPSMSNQIEGEVVFNTGMAGFNLMNTYSHRNLFGGSEILELRVRYGTLFDHRLPGNLSNKLFNNDFQISANIVLPRIVTPFWTKSVGQYGLPRTTFTSSLQMFNQKNTYSNRYLINSLNYSWFQKENILHSLSPIIIEYRDGRLNPAFSNSLIEQGYLLYVMSNDRHYFGLGSQYALTYNLNKLLTKENFNFIRASVETSGNLLSLLGKTFNLNKNAEGQRLIFKVPYLQYVKGEIDYRWYKYFGLNRQFVARVNMGAAIPYGNNTSLLIFEKNFFAGGMNGIRAWQARTLGPGNYNRAQLENEELRLNLRNLDQLGELKLETNLEYRFRIMNNLFGTKLNGATFIDAGNIWALKKENNWTGREFRADQFLSQIAIGSGFGLRLDLNYFVLRLDAGLKIKDPQFLGKEQWVILNMFNNPRAFRRQYLETHRPDRYSFIQYNFSVGMPF